MQKLILMVLLVLYCGSAWGATYYVRADGTVSGANKSLATSPNNSNTSLSMAACNSAAFSAGDSVLFSSQGGTFATSLALPSSGSNGGAVITYANVPGETPTISTSTGYQLSTASKSYVTVRGFNLISTSTTQYNANITITGAGAAGITLDNITMAGPGANLINNIVSAAANQTGITLSNISATGAGTGKYAISMSGTGVSNVSLTGINGGTSNYGVYVANAGNVTTSSVVATAINYTSVTSGSIGAATLESNRSGDTRNGLIINGSTGITVNDVSYAGNDYPMIIGGASSNITINRFVCSSGLSVRITDTATNITLRDGSVNGCAGITVTDGAGGAPSYINLLNMQSNNNNSNGVNIVGASTHVVIDGGKYNYNGNNGVATHSNNGNSPSYVSIGGVEAAYNGTANLQNEGGGVAFHDATTNVVVKNSVFFGNYNAGINAVGTGDGIIENITNWGNCHTGSTWFGVNTSSPCIRGNSYFALTGGAGYVIRNVISGGGGLRERLDYGPTYTTWDHNIYYQADPALFRSTDGSTNMSWASYASSEPTSQFIDPGFVSASDHRLLPSSPAIGAGSNTPWTGVSSATDPDGNPITDAEGNVFSRWIGGVEKSTVDIGAYQYPSDALTITADGAKGGYFNAAHPYAWALPDSPAGYSILASGDQDRQFSLTMTGLNKGRIKVRLTDGVGSQLDSTIPIGVSGGSGGFRW